MRFFSPFFSHYLALTVHFYLELTMHLYLSRTVNFSLEENKLQLTGMNYTAKVKLLGQWVHDALLIQASSVRDTILKTVLKLNCKITALRVLKTQNQLNANSLHF
jgi:hypothetical protein